MKRLGFGRTARVGISGALLLGTGACGVGEAISDIAKPRLSWNPPTLNPNLLGYDESRGEGSAIATQTFETVRSLWEAENRQIGKTLLHIVTSPDEYTCNKEPARASDVQSFSPRFCFQENSVVVARSFIHNPNALLWLRTNDESASLARPGGYGSFIRYAVAHELAHAKMKVSDIMPSLSAERIIGKELYADCLAGLALSKTFYTTHQTRQKFLYDIKIDSFLLGDPTHGTSEQRADAIRKGTLQGTCNQPF